MNQLEMIGLLLLLAGHYGGRRGYKIHHPQGNSGTWTDQRRFHQQAGRERRGEILMAGRPRPPQVPQEPGDYPEIAQYFRMLVLPTALLGYNKKRVIDAPAMP